MGNGTIDGGSVAATLDAQEAGDNQVSFAAGSNELAVAFARFISSSLSLQGDQFSAQTGEASVSEGVVSVDPRTQHAEGSIGQVQVESLQGSVQLPK